MQNEKIPRLRDGIIDRKDERAAVCYTYITPVWQHRPVEAAATASLLSLSRRRQTGRTKEQRVKWSGEIVFAEKGEARGRGFFFFGGEKMG